MDWVFIGLGVTAFFVLVWYLHRRFGGEPTQTHSNVKPAQDHDPMEVAKATFMGIPPSR